MAEIQQIIFSVGDGEYGMDVSHVIAIETLTKVVFVPNAANHILGIVNLRGEALPIYSLRSKFGLPELPLDENTKIIVTKSNNVTIAFKVDIVKEIVDCEPEMMSEFPDVARGPQTAYVDKIVNKAGRLFLMLDQNKLVAKEESEAISQFINDATAEK